MGKQVECYMIVWMNQNEDITVNHKAITR